MFFPQIEAFRYAEKRIMTPTHEEKHKQETWGGNAWWNRLMANNKGIIINSNSFHTESTSHASLLSFPSNGY